MLPWDGRDHYLAGVYRTDLADQVDALVAAGERSMRALAETVVTQRVVMAEHGRWRTSIPRPTSALQIAVLPLVIVPAN